MAAAEPSLRSGSDSMEARIVAVCREFPAVCHPLPLLLSVFLAWSPH